MQLHRYFGNRFRKICITFYRHMRKSLLEGFAEEQADDDAQSNKPPDEDEDYYEDEDYEDEDEDDGKVTLSALGMRTGIVTSSEYVCSGANHAETPPSAGRPATLLASRSRPAATDGT